MSASGRRPTFDNVLTEEQRSRFPDEPEEQTTFFQDPEHVQTLDFGDRSAAAGVIYGFLTPMVDDEVVHGDRMLTDVGWRKLRALESILHDGPVSSLYASEDLLDHFDESPVPGRLYRRGENPLTAVLKPVEQLQDRLDPLRRNPRVDEGDYFDRLQTAVDHNRLLTAYQTSPQGTLTDSRSFAFVYDPESDQTGVDESLTDIAKLLAQDQLEDVFGAAEMLSGQGRIEGGQQFEHDVNPELDAVEDGSYELVFNALPYEGDDLDVRVEDGELYIEDGGEIDGPYQVDAEGQLHQLEDVEVHNGVGYVRLGEEE
ncbi:MAG: hypothetical protein ABEI58_02170 [Candidatus Nanohaloarchaea archaeon]